MKFNLNFLKSEPVRTFEYPALVALVGFLVAKGWVDSSWGDIVTGVVAAALGVPAVEVTRAKVFSPATAAAIVSKAITAIPQGQPPIEPVGNTTDPHAPVGSLPVSTPAPIGTGPLLNAQAAVSAVEQVLSSKVPPILGK